MEISDKTFVEMLESCFPIYKERSEREQMVFMCNLIKILRVQRKYTKEEVCAAEQRIRDRIYPYFTLYQYLENDTKAPTPFTKAVQFYEDWIAELKQKRMQAEIDQLKRQVYFQGNAALSQLLELIDAEFRAEDRNRHRLQNALLRRIIRHVETINNQLDTEATESFNQFINQQKVNELNSLIARFQSNTTVDDMRNVIIDRIDELTKETDHGL